MEVIWTFPLFITFPLIGLILITFGIMRLRKGKSKSVLVVGLSFLSLPFIYLTIMSILHLGLENRLEGKYNIGSDNETLYLKNDRTFELKSSVNFLNSGTGTWKTQEIDFPILMLNFKAGKQVWLEIKENDSIIKLVSMPGESDITSDFLKKAQSR